MSPSEPTAIGRYLLYDEIASGGMASVHLARLIGGAGFSRTVAVKRMHRFLARDPEFVSMFIDEARLAARIRHPNVVPTLDVISQHGEALLVMEYVHGESLSRLVRTLMRTGGVVDVPIACAVIRDVLAGLHAAHEARTERGEPLEIVHRDVSPQNILIGDDGAARLIDFGVAKAAWRYQSTREGQLKGKLAYMAPEQVRQGPVDRRTDVFAASVVLWELLTLRRLFEAGSPAAVVLKIVADPVPPPSALRPGIPSALDEVVLRGLHRDPDARFATAREMALALEETVASASMLKVAAWVESLASERLADVARRVSEIESAPSSLPLSGATSSLKRSEAPTDVASSLASPVPTEQKRRFTVAVTLVVVVLLVVAGLVTAPRMTTSVLANASIERLAAAPSVAPTPEASAEPVAPASARPRRPVTSQARPKPSADCRQNFYVDEKGIKHLKRECL